MLQYDLRNVTGGEYQNLRNGESNTRTGEIKSALL